MRSDGRRRSIAWPQWTTLAVGGLLLISGLLQLVVSARLTLPITDSFVIPLAGPVTSMLEAVARAAGFFIAAVGLHGEIGFTGHSRSGKVAMIVWGFRDLGFFILSALPATSGSPSAVILAAAFVLQVVFVLAALTAAIAVARARVLAGWVRWTLLPLAVVEILFAVLSNTPLLGTVSALSLLLALAAWPTQFIEPVLTLTIAISLLTWGRLEAVKHRAQLIHDAW